MPDSHALQQPCRLRARKLCLEIPLYSHPDVAISALTVDCQKTCKKAVCWTGRDPIADVAAFKERGANVLVGTPGRLHDVFERSDVLDARRLEACPPSPHLLSRQDPQPPSWFAAFCSAAYSERIAISYREVQPGALVAAITGSMALLIKSCKGGLQTCRESTAGPARGESTQECLHECYCCQARGCACALQDWQQSALLAVTSSP